MEINDPRMGEELQNRLGVFSNWLKKKNYESSAFTRRRHGAALGLYPSIPDAMINSRSTATPFERKSIMKRNKLDKIFGK